MEFSRPEYWSSLFPLQGIFPTQGSNSSLRHCRRILYQLSHKGSPRILEWVAYPFSSRSSQPRNQTGLSCIAGRFFTNWGIREAHNVVSALLKVHANHGSKKKKKKRMWLTSEKFSRKEILLKDDQNVQRWIWKFQAKETVPRHGIAC